ncbi:MAG: hypothetical protein ACI4KM_02360 [Oscillospiraceae bacterium]
MIILPNQVNQAIDVLEKAGYDAYIVGACVRELLLGEDPQDFDIVTNAGINDILFAFRDYRISDESMQRGEVLVTVVGMIISISPYRREIVGSRVIYADDLETDLARRGFTMNAIAYSPRAGLIDPYGGRSCLTGDEKQIVAIGETVTNPSKDKNAPETYYDMSRCFTTEPTRLLQAIRYCAERDFVIEEGTRAAMRANVACFEYADTELVRSELTRIVMGKFAAKVLEQYADILRFILPEIDACADFDQHSAHHDFTVWKHICRAVGFAVPEASIRFAMLFHDLGKPDCFYIDSCGKGHFKGHGERSRILAECIMRRLDFDKKLSEEISWLVYHHDVEIPEDRKELKRLIREIGADDLRKLIQMEIADNRAKTESGENDRTKSLRNSLAALNEIIDTGECYDMHQLAVQKRELLERRIVTSDAEADALMAALFDIVLDKPSFNNKLMLLDMAEKSRKKAEELAAERAAKLKEQQDRRNEPVYSRRKRKPDK